MLRQFPMPRPPAGANVGARSREEHRLTTSIPLRRTRLLAGIAMLAAALPAAATDVVPMFGMRVGGELASRADPNDSTVPSSLSIASATSYGGIVDVPLSGGERALELYFSRQATTLSGGEFLAPPVGDLTVTVMHVGLADTTPADDPRLSWLLIGTAGATHFDMHSSSDTRLSIGLGGAVRWMVSPHVGLRGDLRALVTFAGGGQTVIVCNGGCAGHYQGTIVLQGEATLGIVVRF